MPDTLREIFRLQKELATSMDLSRYPTSVDEKLSALATALIHEAVELQRLTSWKWWKRPVPLDEAEVKAELIDLWHFLVQACIEVGMTPDEILKEYSRKNRINRERQRSGY